MVGVPIWCNLVAKTGLGDSQVTNYTFKDSKGALWTVNMTQDSHTLSSGYVLRGVSHGDNISYGERVAFETKTQKNLDEAK